jgi:hypothetical protein
LVPPLTDLSWLKRSQTQVSTNPSDEEDEEEGNAENYLEMKALRQSMNGLLISFFVSHIQMKSDDEVSLEMRSLKKLDL